MSEIDPYPVSALTERFGIGRTALYDRLNALGIVPVKQGNKSYISKAQLQQLDALDAHLKNKGSLSDFASRSSPAQAQPEPDEFSESGSLSPFTEPTEPTAPSLSIDFSNAIAQPKLVGFLNFLNRDVQSTAELFANLVLTGLKDTLLVVFPTPLSRTERGLRLSHLCDLESAYQNVWLLSTSELSDLLGLSANTIRGYGEQFEEAGFTFTRAGYRAHREIAWKVGKSNPPQTLQAQILPTD